MRKLAADPRSGGLRRFCCQNMLYDVICQKCHTEDEIEKPIHAALPTCVYCGGTLKRVYSQMPTVQYRAGGFYSTDVTRLQREMGPDRFAKFEAQKADAERRSKAGKLTAYEKALETI